MSRTNTRGSTYRRAAGRTGLLVALAMVMSLATAPLAAAQSTEENVPCPTPNPEAPEVQVNPTLSIGSLIATSSSIATDPKPTAGVPVNLTLSSTTGPIDHYCNQHGDAATNPPGVWNRKSFSRTQHRYDTPGDYTVKRVAFDAAGARSNIAKLPLYVNSPPTVSSFDVSERRPLVGQQVTFTAKASDTDGSIEDYAWELDNSRSGFEARGSRVVWTYRSVGRHEASVRVTDDSGSKRSRDVGTITIVTPAQAASDTIASGPLTGGPAAVTATAPNVDDLLTDTACSTTTRGTRRSDRIRGTRVSDRLLGLSGHDIISGLAGGDCLVGGPGQDRLSGGSGADRLTGGSGSDRLVGGAGADVLSGGGGANRLYGGAGADTLNAVNGKRDLVSCGSGRDSARVDRVDIVRGCERLRRT